MDLRLLGNVEIESGGSIFAPTRSAERCVLATLAFNAGRPVRVDTLTDNIWGDWPPPKADETVATHVRAVRRLLAQAGGDRQLIRNHRPRAYALHIDPSWVDYHRFRLGVADAASLGGVSAAAAGYERALGLWRGEPLEGVAGDWADARRQAMRTEQLNAVCALLDLRLQLGEYAVVAAQARQLAHDFPTERVLVLAMRGLASAGHQALIPEFVAQASERMWQTANVRPGAEIVALGRRLASGSMPVTVERPASGSAPVSGVQMTATHNGMVWQSVGDQIITEG
ncbi:AfsR/SARP family transcriptional regulator [Micromonospora sp. CPCC 206061]|uniref:AfsR/SARP family transcriptional regulator n=1 Tax=Micromonospora sp. CPCC 206061 TaxID=3122410 RepID=UPI002FEEB160